MIAPVSVTYVMHTLKPRMEMARLQTAKPPPKRADELYLSPEWFELRDRVRREAGGRCQMSGCGRREARMYVDHRVELRDGGAPLDRTNVWLLCGSCHTRKTIAERARRAAEFAEGAGVCTAKARPF